jgi:hypothetical protein
MNVELSKNNPDFFLKHYKRFFKGFSETGLVIIIPENDAVSIGFNRTQKFVLKTETDFKTWFFFQDYKVRTYLTQATHPLQL